MPIITIEVSEETYKKLKEDALSRGLTVDFYVASLIEDLVARSRPVTSLSKPKQMTKKGIPDDFYKAFKKWWRLRDEISFEEFVKQAVQEGFDEGDVYEWSYKLWDKFEGKELEIATKLSEMVKSSKVLFLSELKPKNPKEYVRIAKSAGVKVLEGVKDVVLVESDFYKTFLEKLKKLSREVKGLRGAEEKLLKFMQENGLVYLDVNGHWKLC
ncbi:MAG: hypothetical protein QXQ20_06510 [Candidatus Nezhaarchaeales archaeon]|nr:MAG: hypothetical protein DSO05_06320 [Candidatus Nezhaarchaeota archaeon WYZ-LMO7]TDA35206.1 MAG: hypothetical protein DSO06_03155 [Candidatus Nezhaarchaeota archaeon WYZ-LMO8]